MYTVLTYPGGICPDAINPGGICPDAINPGGTCPCYIPGWYLSVLHTRVVYMPGYLSGGVYARIPLRWCTYPVGTSEWCTYPGWYLRVVYMPFCSPFFGRMWAFLLPRSLGECGGYEVKRGLKPHVKPLLTWQKQLKRAETPPEQEYPVLSRMCKNVQNLWGL